MSKLRVEGVGRTFPGVRGGPPTEALQPTHLTVADNDFITILGPSGCGKSTLLRIVAGLDRPTLGRVLLEGTPVEGPGADRGMVFQSYTLFPWLTVRQNISFGLREKGMPAASSARSSITTSPRSGCAGFEHHFPKMLSGGMQQRTAIARALANGPKILLLDEPFGALDNQTRGLMQELLLGIWESEKKTVLFVTHDIEEAIFMAGRVVVMSARPGHIKAEVRGRPAAPATLHAEDHAGVLCAQGAADRGDPGRGVEGGGDRVIEHAPGGHPAGAADGCHAKSDRRLKEQPMLVEILRRTPSWVFVLFFVLLAVGYFQSKDRTVGRGRVSLLPVAMTALSLFGVLSAFGTAPVGLVSWVGGVGVAGRIGVALAVPRGVSFSAESRSSFVPGSWLPLALMMAIFFTKYAVGVVLARQLPIAGELAFIGAVSFCFGSLSGLLLARAVVIWRAARHGRAAVSSARFHADAR